LKLSRSIHLVDNSLANVYIVTTNKGYLIIDAGVPENFIRVISYLRKNNFSLEKCLGIIITHYHSDHTGCLADLKEMLKTKVFAHKEEAPFISGKAKLPRGREFKHTDVDVEVNDGDLIYGLQVIHTPGHTPGSICLYYPAEKALFIGDLIVNENNILTEIPTQYSLDPEKNREAIKHVYEVVDFELLLPSHGEPILKNGKEKLLTLIKSFEK